MAFSSSSVSSSEINTPNTLFSVAPSGVSTPFSTTCPQTPLESNSSSNIIEKATQDVLRQNTNLNNAKSSFEPPPLARRKSTSHSYGEGSVISHLDLPALYKKPSAEVLITTLALFSRSSGPVNFNGPEKQSKKKNLSKSRIKENQNDDKNGLNNDDNSMKNGNSNDYDDDDEEDDDDNDDDTNYGNQCSAVPGSGFFDWLTKLVASPLLWISDEEKKEDIWSMASTLMAERCGRTAAPKITRRIRVPGMKEALIKLNKLENGNITKQNDNDGSEEEEEEEDPSDILLIEPSLTEDLLGLKTWGSSYILASRLVREVSTNEKYVNFFQQSKGNCPTELPKLLNFTNPVLELGTGTGLVGIVAARLGLDVIVTDLPEIMANLEANVEANRLQGDKITSEILDWSNPEKDGFVKNHKLQSFPTILISDPIYSSQHPYMIQSMVSMFLSKSSDSQLCLQLPLRPKFEDIRELLYTLLKNLGLVRIRYEEESGYDDFGKSKFAWSLWIWEPRK